MIHVCERITFKDFLHFSFNSSYIFNFFKTSGELKKSAYYVLIKNGTFKYIFHHEGDYGEFLKELF